MSDAGPESIGDLSEFFAHAYALECESAERYEDLADTMDVHNNPEVAALFRQLAEFGERHAQEVVERAEGLTLPEIAPWEYKWTCPEGPESVCSDELHYQMNTYQALLLALHNETRGRDFYARVAAGSPDPEVRHVADEMTNEEAEHVRLLDRWVARAADGLSFPPEDLDPPNAPE